MANQEHHSERWGRAGWSAPSRRACSPLSCAKGRCRSSAARRGVDPPAQAPSVGWAAIGLGAHCSHGDAGGVTSAAHATAKRRTPWPGDRTARQVLAGAGSGHRQATRAVAAPPRPG